MQRDVLSPLTPMAPPQSTRLARGTPKELVSPSTRRVASITSPSPVMQHLSTNDDEAERKARRRSRVMELQSLQMTSPATPPDKRRSLPYGGLSNHQLAEHYTNCIKLSAENKITSKNAFGLHLIDYMSELLKKKELDNFQVASSTLDASAKIYAGRVDAIHSETYKVLSGLGRGAEKKQHDDENVELDQDEGDKAPEKKKKRRRAKTIETNLKNITLDKFDLEFEVDPLFEKTAAAFDEGGTSGLLLNHLQCFDGSMELVLDSSSVVTGNEAERKLRQSQAKELVDLTEFRDVYSGMNFNYLEICPSFSNFEFTNWDRESTDTIRSMIQKMSKSDHAFDMDAEPEPIPEPAGDTEPGADLSFNADYDDDASNGNESESSDMTVIMGDGQEAQLVDDAINSMKHGTIGTLMQVLSTEPGEYSYFNTSNMKMWAGPEHWKPGLSKGLATETQVTDKDKKPKKKKQEFKLEYEQPIEMESFFKKSRASTTNSKKTLLNYSRAKTTLPDDIHYDGEKLFRLFSKPNIMVKRQEGGIDTMDEAVDNYNYDNENDRENFCPAIEGADDDNDDHDGDLDFSGGGSQFIQDSQGSLGDSAINTSVFIGDNLVAQPSKVNKIDINYAKTAKRVDVKRLKAAMWGLLINPKEEEKKQDTEESDKDEPKSKKAKEKDDTIDFQDGVKGKQSFQRLLQQLPDKVSKNMCKNLSVPIAFVSLLHLANEKTLSIHGNEEMSDLFISQDSKSSNS